MTSLLALIVVLGVLIFVHEFGHFLAARSVGIAVLRFSFGLGPKTPLAKKIGETEYCLSWVPFGGYVKMAGAEDDEAGGLEGGAGPDAEALKAIPPERMFDHKPLAARVFVISAGVLMNVLFAIVVYAAIAWHYGVPHDDTTTIAAVRTDHLPLGAAGIAMLQPGDRVLRINGDSMTGWAEIVRALLTAEELPIRIDVAGRAEPVLVDVPLSAQQDRASVVDALSPAYPPVLGEVLRGDSAFHAGLKSGDRIVRADGDTVRSWQQFFAFIRAHPATRVTLVVARGGVRRLDTIRVTPRVDLHDVEAPGQRIGKIGVGPRAADLRPVSATGAVRAGVEHTLSDAGTVLWTIKNLVLGRLSPRDIGGPILIGQMSGEAARLGLDVFFGFMAFFSVNLAVLNLLPIPVLDGGHLVFLLIEGIKRRPLSLEVRQRWMTVGLVVVLMLMVLAIYNDVMRVIR